MLCRRTVSYKLVEASDGDAWMATSDGTKYSPNQIGGFMLKNLKQIAGEYAVAKSYKISLMYIQSLI